MPQVIPFIATAVAQATASAAFAATGSFVVAGTVATVTLAAVPLAATLALTAGFNAFTGLFAPGLPQPEALSFPVKQSIPIRQSGYGIARLSGAYVAYTTATDGTSTDVLAMHDGQISAWISFYLNDDKVSVTAGDHGWVTGCPARNDGRYSTGDKVEISTRSGVTPQTYIGGVGGAAIPGWASTARGDGIATLALGCRTPLAKYYQTIYPNGLPQPSAVAALALISDFRTGDVDAFQNPVLALADYLTTSDRGGLGFDFARRITPTVDLWTAAADACDGVDGGQPYACGGVYKHTTAPSEVIGTLISCCDGWLGQTYAGALTIYAGRYTPPTVTLDDDVITGYALPHGVEAESAVNVLNITYTSPDHDYTQVEADPWRDDASIAEVGERPAPLDLPWVQDLDQARRLAKRRMSRLAAGSPWTVSTNLGGMEALGHRYLRLRITELDAPETGDAEAEPFDVVVEVQRAEIDLANLALTFTVLRADPEIDAWNEEEAGTAPAVVTPSPPAALAAPTISSIEVVRPQLNAEVRGIRIRVTVAAVGRADAVLSLRWRHADGYWIGLEPVEAASSGVTVITFTGVTAQTSIFLSVQMTVGDGRVSPWSADYGPVSTTVDPAPFTGAIAPTTTVSGTALSTVVTQAANAAAQTALNTLKARVDAAGIP